MTTSAVKVLKRIRVATLLLSFLGLGLCGYSIYVSLRKEADKDYKAFCDIDDNISCSKVFTSRWGKGFGFLGSLLGEDSPFVVSNAVYGAVFYALVIVLGEIKSEIAAKIQKFTVLIVNLMSIYLAYILFYILKDFCVICISTYVINLLIAVCCFVRVSYCATFKPKKKSGKVSNNESTQKSSTTKKNNSNKNAMQNKNATQNASPNKNVTQNKNLNATPKKNATPNKNAQNKNTNATQNKNTNQTKNANQNKNNQIKNKNAKNDDQNKNPNQTKNANQTKNTNQNKIGNQNKNHNQTKNAHNKNAAQSKNSTKPNKTPNSTKSSKKKVD